MTLDLFYTGVQQGLILAIIAFGVMIPFRFVNFPDLTAEGAYPLGGAVCATLLVMGMPCSIAVLLAVVAGGLIAVCTSLIAFKVKIHSLLAGIIVSTMAYSVNLRILGKPNISLFNTSIADFEIFSLAIIIIVCLALFAIFLHSDYGLRFRAIGHNPKFAAIYYMNILRYNNIGLFIAGSMFGLAGAIIVQIQQYADVGMGVGIVIHGLASLMIGESIIGNKTVMRQLISPIVGALVYQQIQGVALSFGLAPSDLKFFTGAIVLTLIALNSGAKK